MRYVPHTPAQIAEMLAFLGLSAVDELFAVIPAEVRFKGELSLPPALDEVELRRELEALAGANPGAGYVCFLGAGAYDHYVPAAVKALAGRPEFLTAYTPYQPERSQGTLAAIFEYQTMLARLTGMDVVNASVYDGASALAEAVLMAFDIKGRRRVIVSAAVHPEYVETVKTYCYGVGGEVSLVPYTAGYETDWGAAEGAAGGEAAALVVSVPNFFGVVEDVRRAQELAREKGLLLVVVASPVSLALLKPPAAYGADLVVGEGQPLGSALSFGGPYLGFLGARATYVRRVPGRLVGETVDASGRRAFVLTLQAREQHIRREKATSNICSNQAHNALLAAIYLAYLGPRGLRDVAYHSHARARYFMERIERAGRGVRVLCRRVFNELVVEVEGLEEKYQQALKKKILPGLKLERFFPEEKNRLLVAFTEKRTKGEIDALLEVLGVE